MLKSKNLKYTLPIAAILAVGSVGSTYAATENAANLKDNSYVTLSGTVGKIIDEDEFNLITSSGTIKVDTNDDWPALSGSNVPFLVTGDRVTVSGQVDDNYFTKKEIDASSVTLINESYSTTYSLPKDDTQILWWWYTVDDYDPDNIRLSGYISEIIDDDEFILKYMNGGSIKVDLSEVEGMDNTKIFKLGDTVTVYGEVEDNWYEDKEIEANYIYHGYTYPTRG